MLDLPDFMYRNPDTGIVTGFEADIARVLAQHIFGGTLSRSYECLHFVVGDMTQLEGFVRTQHVDIALANIADTPLRRETMSFAGHFLASSHSPLIALDAPDIVTVSDLGGLRVAAGEGSTDVSTLLAVDPRVNLVALPTATDCVNAVLNGNADAYWTTRANGAGYIRAAAGQLREASFQYRSADERWAVAIAKGDRPFREFIDDVVDRALESGQFNRWLNKCFA